MHEIETTQPRHTVVGDSLFLLLLGISLFVVFPHAAISGDHARDLDIAADIVEGLHLPMNGPLLAGLFHLGPAWYYLLAGLQSLGLEAYGIHLLIALIATLQFPLAYRAGRLWQDRATGLLWAGLLLVPSWGLYEQLLPGHTSLTGVSTAAMLLLSVRLVRRPRPLDVYLVAMLATLAIHAHPTSLLLFPIPVVCVLTAWRRHGIPGWHLAGSLVIPALLLLPAMLSGDWSPGAAVREYLSSDQGQGSLAQVGPLAWQMTGGPLHYWLQEVAGWPGEAALLSGLLWAGVMMLGLTAALHRAWRGDRIALLLLATAALSIAGLALGRAIFPYYMFGGVRVLLIGLVACGWSGWLRSGIRLHAALALAVLLYWSVVMPAVSHLKRGDWPFAFVPLFNVTAAWQEPVPLGLTTTKGMQRSGRWLCEHAGAAVHGAWGQMLVITRAIEGRLACGLREVRIGGSAGDRSHWIGLTASLAESVDVPAQDRAGPWRVFPVSRVVYGGETIRVPADIPHPPKPVLPLAGPEQQTLDLSIEAHERGTLAVSNLAFGSAPAPTVRLNCADERRLPVASDAVTRLFKTNCGEPLALQIESRAPEHLDVVVLRPDLSP